MAASLAASVSAKTKAQKEASAFAPCGIVWLRGRAGGRAGGEGGEGGSRSCVEVGARERLHLRPRLMVQRLGLAAGAAE